MLTAVLYALAAATSPCTHPAFLFLFFLYFASANKINPSQVANVGRQNHRLQPWGVRRNSKCGVKTMIAKVVAKFHAKMN